MTTAKSRKKKESAVSRTTLDLEVDIKNTLNALNDNYVFSRNNFFKPFCEAILRNLANHDDNKRLLKEIFKRM